MEKAETGTIASHGQACIWLCLAGCCMLASPSALSIVRPAALDQISNQGRRAATGELAAEAVYDLAEYQKIIYVDTGTCQTRIENRHGYHFHIFGEAGYR